MRRLQFKRFRIGQAYQDMLESQAIVNLPNLLMYTPAVKLAFLRRPFQAFSSSSFLASADFRGAGAFTWVMTWSVTSQETRISSTLRPK